MEGVTRTEIEFAGGYFSELPEVAKAFVANFDYNIAFTPRPFAFQIRTPKEVK